MIDWHGVTEKFGTMAELKQKLTSSLSSHVPSLSEIDKFNIGYFHSRPQMKSWLISDEDLQVMYSKAGDKEILLWCDGKPQSTGRKRKNLDRDSEDLPHSSKHTTNFNSDEEEIETCVRELQDIHGDKYSYGECRIWARMIKNRQWKDKEKPPNIPMIRGKAGQKGKTDMADTLAMATAAVAIIKALQPGSSDTTSQSPTVSCAHTPDGMSPGKKVQLRSQYLKQLKEIQNLCDENVLSAEEFLVEKDTILQTLRELK